MQRFAMNHVSGRSRPVSRIKSLYFCIAIYKENVIILAAVPTVATGIKWRTATLPPQNTQLL